MRELRIEPMDAYETRLAADLRSLVEPARRRIDPLAVAHEAAAAAPASRWGLDWRRGRPLRILVVALLVLAVAVVLAGIASRRFVRSPSVPGLLAYVQSPPGPWSPGLGTLYLAEPDGTDARPIRTGVDGLAGWSPSGRYLAVVNSTADPNLTIHVLDDQGAEVGTIDAGENADLRWSPVEDILAVITQGEAGARLRLFAPGGSLVRELAVPDGVTTIVNGMSWSPDGSRLMVEGCIGCHDDKYDDTPDLQNDLWIIPADGSSPTRVTSTPSAYEVAPAWSPDGSQILYWASTPCTTGPGCHDGSRSDVWTIDPDGTGARRLIADASGAAWSPDGSQVLFSRFVGKGNDALDTDVFVADADGSHERVLVADPGQDSLLGWNRDGSKVFYIHVDPYDFAQDPTADVPVHSREIDRDGTHQVDLGAGVNGLDQQFTTGP